MKKRVVSTLLALALLWALVPAQAAKVMDSEDAADVETPLGEEVTALEAKPEDKLPSLDKPTAAEAEPEEPTPTPEESAELLETYSGTCGDGLTWSLDTDTGLLTISGAGAMKSSPWYSYREYITSVVIADGVTSIGHDAFSNCTNLTGVTIPDSVTSIGWRAFTSCTGLTSVAIPNSMTIIGRSAFEGCASLIDVTIPNSVTSIESTAFRDCTSLASVTIPDSVTSISSYMFYGCTNLASVTIPDSVTSIENWAFSGCTNLTSVTIPDSVTRIGNGALYGCTGLTCATIPGSVTSIGCSAFEDCTSLISAIISDSVTSIEDWAFYGCADLKTVLYSGTEEQWSAISIGNGNSPLLNAMICYEAQTYPTVDTPVDTGTSIAILDSALELSVGESAKVEALLGAYLTELYSLAGGVTWTSSDSSIITFSDDYGSSFLVDPLIGEGGYGYVSKIITAHKPGLVTITATTPDGATSERYVTVTNVINMLGISERNYKMSVGGDFSLYATIVNDGTGATSCTWNTSNADVVALSSTGAESVTHMWYELPIGKRNDSVPLYAKAEGTATVSCTWNGLTVSTTITVCPAAQAVATISSNYYNTPVYNEDALATLNIYANEWNKAYQNYINTLQKELNKVEVSGEDARAAAIRQMAADYRSSDENSASKYLTFVNEGAWSDSWKTYAYQALCEAIYDYTDSKISLSGISPTPANEYKIVNAVANSIHSIKETYSYGNIDVTVNMLLISGAKQGTITCTDGKRTLTAGVVSTIGEVKGIVSDYLDEMAQLEYNVLDNIYSAVATDILGESFTSFTESFLKENLTKTIDEQLAGKGFGKVRDTLLVLGKYGTTVYSGIKAASDGDVSWVLKQATKPGFTYSIDIESIMNDAVKVKAKKLNSASEKLISAVGEYQRGELTPAGAWDKFWDWIINCPVNVGIYDANGTQVGYVGDDDLWYDSSILYIEEDNGSKAISCLVEDRSLTLRAIGSDYGVLNCSVERYVDGAPVGRANFYDILLTGGTDVTLATPSSPDTFQSMSLTVDGSERSMDEYIAVGEDACVKIAATPEDPAMGSVFGGGYYTCGDGVVLHVTPNEGFRFGGWYDGDTLVCAEPVYEFTAREDISLTARFYARERSFANELIYVVDDYADMLDVSAEQIGGTLTVSIVSTGNGAQLPELTVCLATYGENGEMLQLFMLDKAQSNSGLQFSGSVPNAAGKLFVLDASLAPVIKAYSNSWQ